MTFFISTKLVIYVACCMKVLFTQSWYILCAYIYAFRLKDKQYFGKMDCLLVYVQCIELCSTIVEVEYFHLSLSKYGKGIPQFEITLNYLLRSN